MVEWEDQTPLFQIFSIPILPIPIRVGMGEGAFDTAFLRYFTAWHEEMTHSQWACTMSVFTKRVQPVL